MRGRLEKTYGCINGFVQARFRELANRIFRNDKNIKILDAYPMIEANFDTMPFGNIHPGGNLVMAEARYLADIYCHDNNDENCLS